METKICENCGKEHDGSYGSGRFCSQHCRRQWCGKKNTNPVCNLPESCQKSKEEGWKCLQCGQIFRTRKEKQDHTKEYHPEFSGRSHKAWNKGLTLSTSDILLKRSIEIKKKNKDRVCEPTLKNHTEETKIKIKNARLRYLADCSGKSVCYNKNSIPVLERIAKEHGWNLQHAENGGEFYTGNGYFVDAYDKDLNIVVEYDEGKHYIDVLNNVLKSKDVKRQKEIIEHLKCQYYRYNEVMGVLWKVN